MLHLPMDHYCPDA
jgi:hypothetical protein